MFDVGFGEVALVCLVALVVFGPEKLPGLAKQAGKLIGNAKKIMNDVKSEIEMAAESEIKQDSDQAQ